MTSRTDREKEGYQTVPGDKSITHRALILSGLTEGQSVIHGALTSLDARSTAGALRSCGVEVSALRHNATIKVKGTSLWHSPTNTLDCGNSGTTARLLLGALAGMEISARLSGDSSLRNRPMARITEPLAKMGARFEGSGSNLPIGIIGGGLRPLTWRLPVASAQIKSCLILAGLTGRVAVTLIEPSTSRDHTERLLESFGYRFVREGNTLSFEPTGRLEPGDFHIPGDPSSAAFLLAVAALGQIRPIRINNVGVNPTRTGFLAVMQRMGAQISLEDSRLVSGEPVATMVAAAGGNLKAVDVKTSEVPHLIDEVPVLACLAGRAEGVSRFRGLAELRVKESDRLSLIASNLRDVGISAAVEGDDLLVEGNDRPLGGKVTTAGDHRIAMAFSVLDPGLEIDNPSAAEVSFPGFYPQLAELRSKK